jgi:hypothetical protein
VVGSGDAGRRHAELVSRRSTARPTPTSRRQLEAGRGRQFRTTRKAAGKAVCIIGNTVKKELFGNASPLGNSVRVKNFDCEIIGTARRQGQGGDGAGSGRHGADADAHRAAPADRHADVST